MSIERKYLLGGCHEEKRVFSFSALFTLFVLVLGSITLPLQSSEGESSGKSTKKIFLPTPCSTPFAFPSFEKYQPRNETLSDFSVGSKAWLQDFLGAYEKFQSQGKAKYLFSGQVDPGTCKILTKLLNVSYKSSFQEKLVPPFSLEKIQASLANTPHIRWDEKVPLKRWFALRPETLSSRSVRFSEVPNNYNRPALPKTYNLGYCSNLPSKTLPFQKPLEPSSINPVLNLPNPLSNTENYAVNIAPSSECKLSKAPTFVIAERSRLHPPLSLQVFDSGKILLPSSIRPPVTLASAKWTAHIEKATSLEGFVKRSFSTLAKKKRLFPCKDSPSLALSKQELPSISLVMPNAPHQTKSLFAFKSIEKTSLVAYSPCRSLLPAKPYANTLYAFSPHIESSSSFIRVNLQKRRLELATKFGLQQQTRPVCVPQLEKNTKLTLVSPLNQQNLSVIFSCSRSLYPCPKPTLSKRTLKTYAAEPRPNYKLKEIKGSFLSFSTCDFVEIPKTKIPSRGLCFIEKPTKELHLVFSRQNDTILNQRQSLVKQRGNQIFKTSHQGLAICKAPEFKKTPSSKTNWVPTKEKRDISNPTLCTTDVALAFPMSRPRSHEYCLRFAFPPVLSLSSCKASYDLEKQSIPKAISMTPYKPEKECRGPFLPKAPTPQNQSEFHRQSKEQLQITVTVSKFSLKNLNTLDVGKRPALSYKQKIRSTDIVALIDTRMPSSSYNLKELSLRTNRNCRLTQATLSDMPSLEQLITDSIGDEFMVSTKVLPKITSEGYIFSVQLRPFNRNSLYSLPHRVYYILDSSSSIEKHRFETFKRSITRSLRYLDKNAKFNVFTFTGTPTRLSQIDLRPGSEAMRRTKKFLAKTERRSSSGTDNLYSLIRHLEQRSAQNGEMTTVIFLSDGNLFRNLRMHRNSIAGLLKDSRKNFSLYTCCVSDRNNIGMLDWMAKLYHGEMLHVSTHAAFPRRLSLLVKKLHRPLAYDIHVTTADPSDNVRFLHDAKIAENLFADKTYTLYGAAKNLQDINLIIQGKAGDKWLNLTKTISLKNSFKARGQLEKESACQKALLALYEYIEKGSNEKLAEAKEVASEFDVPFPAR